jgi:hypothetical protein
MGGDATATVGKSRMNVFHHGSVAGQLLAEY